MAEVILTCGENEKEVNKPDLLRTDSSSPFVPQNK